MRVRKAAHMKVCCVCRVPKHDDEFYHRAKSLDGLQSDCKQCARGRDASRARPSMVLSEREPYRGVVGGLLIAGYVAPVSAEATQQP